MGKLEDGKPIELINEEELNMLDKIRYNKFKKNIINGLPKLKEGLNAVIDALIQIKKLDTKTEEEKKKMEDDIRKDIIKALIKSMEILIIEDENGNEETEESLKNKTTDELINLLQENVEELEKFINGK